VVILSTDWHFGKSNGKFDDLITESIEYMLEYAKINNIKTLFHLGDILDTKMSINTSSLNKASKIILKLKEHFNEMFFLVGNHDLQKHDVHNLEFLKLANINVIEKDTVITKENKNILMVPYSHHYDLELENIDYIFGHFDIKDFYLNSHIISKEGLDISYFKNIQVYSGHYHKKQSKDNVTYIGNILRFFYGENDEPRGFSVLDLEENKIELIEFEHPARYIIRLSEIDSFYEKLKKGDCVKLKIDKKVSYSILDDIKLKLSAIGISELIIDEQFTYEINEDEDETKVELIDIDYIQFVQNEMQYILKKENDKELINIYNEIINEYIG